jgi:hypothetical protein
MLDNHFYNLMMQMIAENKSHWRIKNNYMKESDCEECLIFWKKMEKDKENHARELNELIKEHLV